MPELGNLAKRGLRAEQRKQLSGALHDLCQPLTTLQCRLEMAILSDSAEAYREAAENGLTECRRIVQLVESMRQILQEAAQTSAPCEPRGVEEDSDAETARSLEPSKKIRLSRRA